MLKRQTRSSERGDTIIEVLFAITVFSLVVVSGLSLMNQGTAASQRSLELTLVRQEVDSQAEVLRFMHDSYVESYYSGVSFNTSDATTTPAEEYYRIITHIESFGAASASEYGTIPCGTPPSGSFIVNPRLATVSFNASLFRYPDTVAKIDYNGSQVVTASQGLWVEGVRSGTSADANQANTGYIDFHIRGCWDGPGFSEPMNIGTIVRLYEPRG